MEQRIRGKAEYLFFTFGLKSVSMDDIARESGVSKKTIYQHFIDKASMVRAIVSAVVERQNKQLKGCMEASGNAVEEMIMIARGQADLVLKLKPVVIYDLKKYFPDSWQLLRRYKEQDLKAACIRNLKAGVAEGVYREDLDLDAVCEFGLVQFSTFFDPENYPDRQKIQNMVCTVTELFLYGIGSREGQTTIKKYFDNTDNEHKA